MTRKTQEVNAVFTGDKYEHLWGYEVWVENNECYCNKLLVLNSGFSSSWHYHERKDETFIILSGEVMLVYAKKDNNNVKIQILKPGNKFRIKPGLIHSFMAVTDQAIVMEVSTTDDDDNIKLKPAKKYKRSENE